MNHQVKPFYSSKKKKSTSKGPYTPGTNIGVRYTPAFFNAFFVFTPKRFSLTMSRVNMQIQTRKIRPGVYGPLDGLFGWTTPFNVSLVFLQCFCSTSGSWSPGWCLFTCLRMSSPFDFCSSFARPMELCCCWCQLWLLWRCWLICYVLKAGKQRDEMQVNPSLVQLAIWDVF